MATLLQVRVIGDSISNQYGPYLEEYLRGEWVYSWSGGSDSSKVLASLQSQQEAGELDMDLLLLNCGLHDIKTDPSTGEKQVPLVEYQKNLEQIAALLQETAVELVWMRTTPCDETVHNHPDMKFHRFAADCDAYNAAADEIMDAAGIKCIDLFAFTNNLGSDTYCDHVHFHEHVREKQAAYIAGWVGHWKCQYATK